MTDLNKLLSGASSWAGGAIDVSALVDEWALRVQALAGFGASPGPSRRTLVLDYIGSLKIRDSLGAALFEALQAQDLVIEPPLVRAVDQLFTARTHEIAASSLLDLFDEANNAAWWWKRVPNDEVFLTELAAWKSRAE